MKVKNYSVRGLIQQLLTSTYGKKGIDEPTNVTNVVVGGDGNGDVKIYLQVDDAIQRPQSNQEVSIDQIPVGSIVLIYGRRAKTIARFQNYTCCMCEGEKQYTDVPNTQSVTLIG